MDLVSVHLYLLPNDASVSIRNASAIIERRIHVKEALARSTTPASYSNTSRPLSQANFEHHSPALSPLSHSAISSYQDSHHNTHASTSSASLSSSQPTITPNSVFPSTTTLSTAEKTTSASRRQFFGECFDPTCTVRTASRSHICSSCCRNGILRSIHSRSERYPYQNSHCTMAGSEVQ